MNDGQFSHSSADALFDRYDKETGKTTPSEAREAIKAIMREKQYDVSFNNVLHLMMLDDIPKYANLFEAQHWIVYVSRIPRKFITTDNPVAVAIPRRKSFFPPTFLERIHYFALTPDICVEACFANDGMSKKIRRRNLFAGSERRIL